MSNTISGTTQLNIPKATIPVQNLEQTKADKTIIECRRAILNIGDFALKESVLGAITNRDLVDAFEVEGND